MPRACANREVEAWRSAGDELRIAGVAVARGAPVHNSSCRIHPLPIAYSTPHPTTHTAQSMQLKHLKAVIE